MIEADTTIHSRRWRRSPRSGSSSPRRYGGADPGAEAIAAVQAQAPKRVALQFTPVRTASFDHRKLAGG